MGKIMLNDIQYGVGGITDAEDVKYGSTNVSNALDNLNNALSNKIGYVDIDLAGTAVTRADAG